jgi:hypothetical protein
MAFLSGLVNGGKQKGKISTLLKINSNSNNPNIHCRYANIITTFSLLFFFKGELTFDPLIDSTLDTASATTRVYSCATVLKNDGLVHIYHHLFANNTIYRLDETDQIAYTFESQYPPLEKLDALKMEYGHFISINNHRSIRRDSMTMGKGESHLRIKCRCLP